MNILLDILKIALIFIVKTQSIPWKVIYLYKSITMVKKMEDAQIVG